jgi:ATP-dependent Clp protease protease subunit
MPTYYNIDTNGKVPKIHIDGQIGDNWFGEGVTSKSFKDEVDALGDVAQIDVHISSVGGNVLDGIAIYNYLKQHKASIATYCDSLAASIASIVFLAGDKEKRHMPKGTELFVHDPLTWAMGNAKQFREAADHLDGKKESLVDIYEVETGLSREEISDLMSNETTLSAEVAVEKGFASNVIDYEKQVMNTVNIADVKASVIMSSELDLSKQQIANLTTKLGEANKELAELKKQPVAATPEQVIATCKAAGFEGLAVAMIEGKLTAAEVDRNIANAKAVADVCVAAGFKADDVIASVNNPVDMLRKALNAQALMHEAHIDNNSSNSLASESGKTTNVVDIYKKRNQAQ